jgi:hypothetical protein
MKRELRLVALLALLLTVLAGCAVTTAGHLSPATPGPTGSAPPMPGSPPPTTTATLGQKLWFDHTGVVVWRVFDPADLSSTVFEPHGRYVVVQITVTNGGTQTLTGNANLNTTVIGSNNQTYTADFGGAAALDSSNCTNFGYGNYVLAPYESSTGCVAFDLPLSVTPTAVRFAPFLGHSYGTWTITHVTPTEHVTP